MISVKLPTLLTGHETLLVSEIFVNDISSLDEILFQKYRLKPSHFYLKKCSEQVYTVRLRLLGGKGGFGSQLRAQGNKMSSKKRAGNYESCRNLNGQRLRTEKHTKMIEEYLAKEPERLSKREQEIREKMQKYLDAPNKKIMFDDPDYLKLCRKLLDNTEDAVRNGLKCQNFSNSDSDDDSEYDSDDQSDEEDENDFMNNGSNEKVDEKDSDISSEDEKGVAVKNNLMPIKVSKPMNRITSKAFEKYLNK